MDLAKGLPDAARQKQYRRKNKQSPWSIVVNESPTDASEKPGKPNLHSTTPIQKVFGCADDGLD
jgi:hypothetical protein